MLVLDASAAVQYAVAADGFGLLGRQVLVAPALLWSEVSSALHDLSRRRSITARRSSRLAAEARQIADRLGWAKTYDAEYVALARLLGCRLFTLDARLRRTASRVIDVVGPSDL